MKFTRRDLLVWSAGAAAGLIVTPVPWKLLDDTSIWSQNLPWIPQPARAPVEMKQSACTLCPNGCGLRVRMAAGWPVGVAGASTHPVTRGALCPLGFAAHQLNWHPKRLRTVRHRWSDSSWTDAQRAFAKARSEGPIIVIDGYPGRAASSVLAAFAEKQHGSYRVVESLETRALKPYETWSGVPASALGYDLENAQTVISFGAPLLDGWGAPGRFTRLWAERTAGEGDPQLRLIQVDSTLSRTAARAWQWILIRPGAESALAAGLAAALLEQKLVPARGPIASASVSDAAMQTGLPADAIRELARTIAARMPAVAIAADQNATVAALNLILGALGTPSGIVRRSNGSVAHVPAEPLITNARAVLIDSSVPWSFIPETDAEVFRFAAWDGGSSKADWLLPAPGFLEELTDIPTAPASAVETYAVAPDLVKPTSEVQSAAEFLVSLEPSLVPVEKIIHSRCENIFRARKGTVHGNEITPVAQLASAEKLGERMSKGAVWVGEASLPGSIRCELKEWPAASVPAASDNPPAWPAPVLPPLASKLYNESSLGDATDRRTV